MKTKKKKMSGSPGRACRGGAVAGARVKARRASWLLIAAATWVAFSPLWRPPLEAKQKKPPTKTIQGEVLDAADQPIAGAAVELTDVTTGKTLGIYSEKDGRYAFTELNLLHDYQVRATSKAQQSQVRRASSLDDRNIVVVNLTIPSPASP